MSQPTTRQPRNRLVDMYRFRDELVDALTRDVAGPTKDDEQITDAPLTRYICGVLYPQPREGDESSNVDPAQDVDEQDDYDEGHVADPAVAMANVKYPSSMGLTFAVDTRATKSVTVRSHAARYELLEAADNHKLRRRRRGSGEGDRWQRIPLALPPVDVPVADANSSQRTLAAGLDLYWRVRAADTRGVASVTVVLINIHRSPPSTEMRDAYAFLQPVIEIEAPQATRLAFADRPRRELSGADEDHRLYQLLYRDAAQLAVGHGCAAEWDLAAPPGGLLRSRVVPGFEVPLADSNGEIQLPCLRMQFVAEAQTDDLMASLRELPSAYERWIAAEHLKVADLPVRLQEIGQSQLQSCADAAARIRKGIESLERDANALDAFRLANKAMHLQRSRSDWFARGRPGQPVLLLNAEWRPFQLAFILLCLEGLVDDASDDRRITDLLWFPTGGGKTEAYLGLIAFTIFLRRLRRGASGAGITALMRYTLRLLTIQQFERASTLICACDHIRETDKRLGDDRISVGLWVGQDATPNTRRVARLNLDKLHAGKKVEKGNPVQLHRCSWCGTPLDHRNYYMAADGSRLVIDCRQPNCDFRGGLPVFVVDEDIYDQHPALLIATVDKFASLPWRSEAAQLFNLTTADTPPPELIIQDELHLISGPLGTLAGLYESAIDLVCSNEGRPPKVIASTATIRRAREQSRSLFDREVRQFPPQGLTTQSSFFAVEADRGTKGTRLYLGLMAPGTSQTTLLVRAYAALLQNAAELAGDPEVRDPYWTLVGYFNSLRVLGGARMQVQDDVDDRMGLLAGASGRPQRPLENRIELTSRESSGDIPEHLARMAVPLPSASALDVILATNMISVGVDIDRLGLMAVMGQPQATSEYIQATSRVGRKYPGLVVVMLNAARSRDRSHYESFVAYHAALYRQVESATVTPFSSRARERALHAVLIALARLRIAALRPNEAASRVTAHEQEIRVIQADILSRIESVTPVERAAADAQLNALIDLWKRTAVEYPDLVYWGDAKHQHALLCEASEADALGLPTLWSLRDVDRSSKMYVIQ